MRWRLSYYMKVTLSGLCSPKCVSFLAGGQCMVYFVYGVLYIFWWGSVWLSIVWPIGWVSHCCKCSPSILSSWSSSWWSLSSSSSWKRNTFARPKSVFRISSSFAINRLWMGLGQVFRLWNYFVDNSLFFSFFWGGGRFINTPAYASSKLCSVYWCIYWFHYLIDWFVIYFNFQLFSNCKRILSSRR